MAPFSEYPLQNAIRHHRSSLKRLVYYERQLEQIDDAGLFEEDRDVSSYWIFSNIVNLSRMIALALCVSPSAAGQQDTTTGFIFKVQRAREDSSIY
ncbi:uncharacterized protein N7477_009017 [Penicillium maclennaniae]|uniref:uncharacterized protein n=1 Tax=Penicillium maclennaniae TaxID=1343394 RepID=UPI002540B500|nr:uncharacterized protein N7477_009017 [Penicillium maclennaniae]KAJ5661401.1 hypothetical protein N7477_009017 [Penicillium maclennaniae]